MAVCRINGEYIQYDTANATVDKGLVVVNDAIFNAHPIHLFPYFHIDRLFTWKTSIGNQAQPSFALVGGGFQLNGGMVDVVVGQIVLHLPEQGGTLPNGHLVTDNCMAGKHI